jgi:hypothetical protein
VQILASTRIVSSLSTKEGGVDIPMQAVICCCCCCCCCGMETTHGDEMISPHVSLAIARDHDIYYTYQGVSMCVCVWKVIQCKADGWSGVNAAIRGSRESQSCIHLPMLLPRKVAAYRCLITAAGQARAIGTDGLVRGTRIQWLAGSRQGIERRNEVTRSAEGTIAAFAAFAAAAPLSYTPSLVATHVYLARMIWGASTTALPSVQARLLSFEAEHGDKVHVHLVRRHVVQRCTCSMEWKSSATLSLEIKSTRRHTYPFL